MPAVVIPISGKGAKKRAFWSLLEVARPGERVVPFGILLADEETDELTLRLREPECFEDLGEQEADFLAHLANDLRQKSREGGAAHLLDALEDSLSHYLRIGDRTAIAYSGDTQRLADRLFDEHVDAEIRPFVTHLPLYGLRAAATRFGEGMESEQEGWLRTPPRLRLTEGMFVARVVGRSMEPLIADGSLCVFRAPVTGSRQGRVVLIEKFGESDFASRYTVKRYARHGARDESAEREAPIRLEPLNPEFEAFELEGDQFRVIAEFVQVLPS
jgi:SOS-response transcriptional repressor LexA